MTLSACFPRRSFFLFFPAADISLVQEGINGLKHLLSLPPCRHQPSAERHHWPEWLDHRRVTRQHGLEAVSGAGGCRRSTVPGPRLYGLGVQGEGGFGGACQLGTTDWKLYLVWIGAGVQRCGDHCFERTGGGGVLGVLVIWANRMEAVPGSDGCRRYSVQGSWFKGYAVEVYGVLVNCTASRLSPPLTLPIT